jgi:hypothetical protein
VKDTEKGGVEYSANACVVQDLDITVNAQTQAVTSAKSRGKPVDILLVAQKTITTSSNDRSKKEAARDRYSIVVKDKIVEAKLHSTAAVAGATESDKDGPSLAFFDARRFVEI